MRAVKGNKVYTIEETQKKHYLEAGFDIIGDDGEIIAYGKGKTVPYDKYEELKKELEAAKEASGDEMDQDAVDTLKAFAQEHNVEVGQARTVAGIVKKIKECQTKDGE